jgi:polygalacturonase
MEGQNLDYFPALVNAYGVDGFTLSGPGTIDGNGLKFWEAFWQRRKENPKCTNLEVSRPRLVFLWNCDNLQIQDVRLHNAGFWTTHLYQCNRAKILDVHIFAPKAPVPAPSTDAIDLDVCSNVLIKGCYMSVNDDAVALKGGKGPWADKDPDNGPNTNILIEDNTYGFCHSTFTCGSENVHTRNVLMRNCTIEGASRMIFLKMRPDTPQTYEYITLENIRGTARTGIYIRPWRQFFDLQGRETPPVSTSRNITFRNIELTTKKFTEVGTTAHDRLAQFTLENLTITTDEAKLDTSLFDGITFRNVMVNGETWPAAE